MKSSWFLSLISGQLPKDISTHPYPHLDSVDFQLDASDKLWSKKTVKDAYTDGEGNVNEEKFQKDYLHASNLFKDYELNRSLENWGKVLSDIGEEQQADKLEDGGTTPAPTPILHQHSLIAAALNLPTTPDFLRVHIGLDNSAPYQVKDVNGDDVNLLDLYSMDELARRNIFNDKTGQTDINKKDGITGYFDSLLHNRVIAMNKLEDGSFLPKVDKYGQFYIRGTQHGEDVHKPGEQIQSAWGAQKKKEELNGLWQHTGYIGSSVLKGMNNTLWTAMQGIAELPHSAAALAGMDNTKDWIEDFKTFAEAAKFKTVSENGENNLLSFEGATPFAADIFSQLIAARGIGKGVAKIPRLKNYAPQATYWSLAGMTAGDIKQAAENAGVSDKWAAVTWAASLPTLSWVNSKFSKYITKGLTASQQQVLYQQALKKSVTDVGGDAFEKMAQGLLTPQSFGNKVSSNFLGLIKKAAASPYGEAIAGEGAEEMAETSLEAASAYIPYLLDKHTQYDVIAKTKEAEGYRFVDENYNLNQFGKQLLLSAIGGGVGGAAGKFLGRKIFKDEKDPELQSLLYYKATGQMDGLNQALDQLYQQKGLFSDKIGWNKLTGKLEPIVTGKETDYVSGNEFVYKQMKEKLDTINSLWDDKQLNEQLGKLKLVNASINDEQLGQLKLNVIQDALKDNDVTKVLFGEFQKLYRDQQKYGEAAKDRSSQSDEEKAVQLEKHIQSNKQRINDILLGHYNDRFYYRALVNTLMSPALHKGVVEEDLQKYGMIPANKRLNYEDLEFLNASFEESLSNLRTQNAEQKQEQEEKHRQNTNLVTELIQKQTPEEVLNELGITDFTNERAAVDNKQLEQLRSYGVPEKTTHEQLLNHLSKVKAEAMKGYGEGDLDSLYLEAQSEGDQDLITQLDAIRALDRVADQIKENKVPELRNEKEFLQNEYFNFISDKRIKRNEYRTKSKKKVEKNQLFASSIDLNMNKLVDDETKRLERVGDKNYNDDKGMLNQVLTSIDQRITQAYLNSTALPRAVQYSEVVAPITQQLLRAHYVSSADIVNAKREILQKLNTSTSEAISKKQPLQSALQKEDIAYGIRKKDLFYAMAGKELILSPEERDKVIDKLLHLKHKVARLKSISDANGFTYEKMEVEAEKKLIAKKVDSLNALLGPTSPILNDLKALNLSPLLDNINSLINSENPDMHVLFNNVLELEHSLFTTLGDKRNELLSKLWQAQKKIRYESPDREKISASKQNSILSNITQDDLNTVDEFELDDTDPVIRDMKNQKIATQSAFNYLFQIITVNPKKFWQHFSSVVRADQFILGEDKLKYASFEQANAVHYLLAFKKNQDFSWLNEDINRPVHRSFNENGVPTGNPEEYFFYKYSTALLGTVGSGKTSMVCKLVEALSNSMIAEGVQGDGVLSTAIDSEDATPLLSPAHGVIYKVNKRFSIGKQPVEFGYFKLVDANEKFSMQFLSEKEVKATATDIAAKKSIVFAKNQIVRNTFENAIGKYNVLPADVSTLEELMSLLKEWSEHPTGDVPFDTIYIDEVTLFNSYELFGNYDQVHSANEYKNMSPEQRREAAKDIKHGLLEYVDKINTAIILNSGKYKKSGIPVKVIFAGDLEQATDLFSGLNEYDKVRINKTDPLTIRRRTGLVTLTEFMDHLDKASKLARTHFYTYKESQTNELNGLTPDQLDIVDYSYEGEHFISEQEAKGLKFYDSYEKVLKDMEQVKKIIAANPSLKLAYIIPTEGQEQRRDEVRSVLGHLIDDTQIMTVEQAQGQDNLHFVFVDAEGPSIDPSNKSYSMNYYKVLNSAIGRARYFGGVVTHNFTDRWKNSTKTTPKAIRAYADIKRNADFVKYYNGRLRNMNFITEAPAIAPAAYMNTLPVESTKVSTEEQSEVKDSKSAKQYQVVVNNDEVQISGYQQLSKNAINNALSLMFGQHSIEFKVEDFFDNKTIQKGDVLNVKLLLTDIDGKQHSEEVPIYTDLLTEYTQDSLMDLVTYRIGEALKNLFIVPDQAQDYFNLSVPPRVAILEYNGKPTIGTIDDVKLKIDEDQGIRIFKPMVKLSTVEGYHELYDGENPINVTDFPNLLKDLFGIQEPSSGVVQLDTQSKMATLQSPENPDQTVSYSCS